MDCNFDRNLRHPRIHFRVILHSANMRHGTNGFTSLPKEGVLRIFSTASAGFELVNLGTKGQHATSRPPTPLFYTYILINKFFLLLILFLCCVVFLKMTTLPLNSNVLTTVYNILFVLLLKF